MKHAIFGVPFEDDALVYEREEIARFFPKRRPNSNKGDYGVAAIVAGCGSLGAPVLAAGACLKSGAGYTKLFLPSEIYPSPQGLLLAALSLPACILREVGGARGELLHADCIAFGMGAGVDCYDTVKALLADYHGKLLLDADALNSLSVCGKEILKRKACEVVVTPHPKEFSRLTGKSVEEILQDPIRMAKAFAQEYNVTVVLKNNYTIIADGGRVAMNVTGSPALAKAGSGDVLAGFLAGTLARGLAPFEASVAACYILGRAGELAAADLGEYSPDATDIIRYLPFAIRTIVK